MNRHRWKGVHYSLEELGDISKEIIQYVDEALNDGDCPLLAGFLARSGLNKNTIYSWEGKHDCIDQAIAYLEACKENALAQNSLRKVWDSGTSRLMLASHHGYTDRSTLQGDAANPLGISYKPDPAKAADEILAAHGNDNGE